MNVIIYNVFIKRALIRLLGKPMRIVATGYLGAGRHVWQLQEKKNRWIAPIPIITVCEDE